MFLFDRAAQSVCTVVYNATCDRRVLSAALTFACISVVHLSSGLAKPRSGWKAQVAERYSWIRSTNHYIISSTSVFPESPRHTRLHRAFFLFGGRTSPPLSLSATMELTHYASKNICDAVVRLSRACERSKRALKKLPIAAALAELKPRPEHVLEDLINHLATSLGKADSHFQRGMSRFVFYAHIGS